ncbi:hypothetical protein [Dysgonomonas sp. Marseille-P4361]|uniref:hypothetical protein n=1 Tax=Dysgonomonas sp. Marseille-P4361 TaxID=2161820 RepID=UPI000D5531A4|nr:hypothetical protein [Dysgonomonas sp. Marseille-P4361]
MDRLKSILADKILDLSTEAGEGDIRARLDKIHRFRDFANACKSLMTKYPGIESELIGMVMDDNFDTAEASSRVDKIVDLAENPTTIIKDTIPTDNSDDERNAVAEETKNYNVIPELKSNQTQSVKEEVEEEGSFFPTEDEMVVIKRNTTIRRVFQVLAIVLAVFVLIFILKFVMLHWQTILIIVGILVILAVLFVGYKRKQK